MIENHINSGNPRLHILNLMKGGDKHYNTVNGPAPSPAAKILPKVLNGALTRSLLKKITSQSARRNTILNGCGCTGCKEGNAEILNKGPKPAARVKMQIKSWLINNKPSNYTEEEALQIGETAKQNYIALTAEEKSNYTIEDFINEWLINNGYNESVSNEANTGGMNGDIKKYLIYGGAGLIGAGLLYMIFKK